MDKVQAQVLLLLEMLNVIEISDSSELFVHFRVWGLDVINVTVSSLLIYTRIWASF
jgi:hypothetical protein